MPIDSHATDARWRIAPSAVFSRDQRDWLTHRGSLVCYLRRLGRVGVRVLRETIALAWSNEHFALRIAAGDPVWVREVALLVEHVPFTVARSVTSLAASRGAWRAIRQLRNRPLAELLYADSHIARSPLASRQITARHPLYRLAVQQAEDLPHSLIARRSLFERKRAPLLVTECFLPALWSHLASNRELIDSPNSSDLPGNLSAMSGKVRN